MNDKTYKLSKDIISLEDLKTLNEARKTYGNNNQILVSVEELNELACVLTKYPRFDSHDEAMSKIRDKVLDERVDVAVILRHVDTIFDFTRDELREHAISKIERLRRWMETNPSFQHTMEDRVVISAGPRPLKDVEFDDTTGIDPKYLPLEEPEGVSCSLCTYMGKGFADYTCIQCTNWDKFKPKEVVFSENSFFGDLIVDNYKKELGFSVNTPPQEISKAISELCGKCPHRPSGCKDESGKCLKFERREFLDDELDRALSRL